MRLGLLPQPTEEVSTGFAMPTGSLMAFVATLWVAIGALGLVAGNSAGTATEASASCRGTGSSLLSVIPFGLGFLVNSFVAALQDDMAHPVAATIAGCSVAAGVTWLLASPRRLLKTDPAAPSAT